MTSLLPIRATGMPGARPGGRGLIQVSLFQILAKRGEARRTGSPGALSRGRGWIPYEDTAQGCMIPHPVSSDLANHLETKGFRSRPGEGIFPGPPLALNCGSDQNLFRSPDLQ